MSLFIIAMLLLEFTVPNIEYILSKTLDLKGVLNFRCKQQLFYFIKCQYDYIYYILTILILHPYGEV